MIWTIGLGLMWRRTNMAIYKVVATRVIHERLETYVEIDGDEADAADYVADNEGNFNWEYNGQDCFEIVSVDAATEEEIVELDRAEA